MKSVPRRAASTVRALIRLFVSHHGWDNLLRKTGWSPNTGTFRAMMSETAPSSPVAGRIVLVCGSLQPGGAERQVVNTLVGLSSARLESVTLLCDHLHGGTPEKYDFYLSAAKSANATVRTIRTDWSPEMERPPAPFARAAARLAPNLATDVANLYFEFRSLRPAVVHAWLDWSNVRAGLAAVLAGVPRILLSGRNLSPRHFALNTNYFLPAYQALVERDPDQLILLNNSLAGAADYAEWLSLTPGRIKMIRNGLLFSPEEQAASRGGAELRARLAIPRGAPVIGGMFRFSAEKRPLLWLETAACIAKIRPDAHFALFGEGSMRPAMENFATAHGIKARTHVCGVVQPASQALSSCDVILLTSSGEGTPNVLLEAQWLGIPVVATDAGGASEAVLDQVTGLVVKTNKAEDLARAVVSILQDPRMRMSARSEGRKFVEASFGMDRMIQETLALYAISGLCT